MKTIFATPTINFLPFGRHPILVGVVGSHAYGLATDDSDIDYRGCFVQSQFQRNGFGESSETYDRLKPDVCLHELYKFMKLAASGNPNILEMFWLPENHYVKLKPAGKDLIYHRDLFLSQKVRLTYGGYAMSQIKRLEQRGDGSFSSKLRKRYSKHARHCFRLLNQGAEILATGNLTVRVKDPAKLFEIGELPPEKLKELFDQEFERFNAIESSLPEEPHWTKLSKLINDIRREYP